MAKALRFCLLVALLVFAASFLTVRFFASPVSSPADDFRAHLLAVDEGRLDDAMSYVGEGCELTITAEALSTLHEQLGSLSNAFKVATVYISEDESRALIEVHFLVTGRKALQPAARVDGRWKLQCESGGL